MVGESKMIKMIRAVSPVLCLAAATLVASATAPKEPRAQERESQAPKAAAAVKPSSSKRSEKASDDAEPATRMTPFGQAKTTSAPRPPRPSASGVSHLVKVEEQGDTIIFRQRTPFGEKVWKRARTELSDQERELLEAHRAAKPSSAGGPATPGSGRPGRAPRKPESAQ